jgi:Uncharacterized conserved protein
MKRTLQFLSVLTLTLATVQAAVSNIRSDEELVFFPAVCYETPDGNGWDVKITGCVFERENRRAARAVLSRAVGIDRDTLTESEREIFDRRVGLFFVDNQRGKRVVIRIGGRTFTAEKSEPNGHFEGSIRLSAQEIRQHAITNEAGFMKLPFQAVLPAKDTRRMEGEASFIQDRGVAVVSDIDDTIKISEVLDRKALLRNTFVNPFRPVPGMAPVFAEWSREPDTQFFYVSASPWQLYEPLAEFVQTNGFPSGVFLLKEFRWKDRTFWNLFADPERYKTERIEGIIKQVPKRRFVLVGDSGERDPEAYGELARRFPKQVVRIVIRDVTSEPLESDRYRRAFRSVPKDTVILFTNVTEIPIRFPASRN